MGPPHVPKRDMGCLRVMAIQYLTLALMRQQVSFSFYVSRQDFTRFGRYPHLHLWPTEICLPYFGRLYVSESLRTTQER